MTKSYRIVRIAHWLFLVFAYVFGIVVQGILAGLVPLVTGGEPIPLVAGVTIPARVLGAINIFISAPVTFLIFHAFASLIRLALEIRERVEKISGSTG